jgi:hypothetical protein
VAAFTTAELGQLDWTLLQDGAITLYSAMSPLERDLGWLSDHGYATHRFDCANSTTFQAQISLALKFREHYGYDDWNGNLDALNDAVGDIEFEGVTGVVLCLVNFEKHFAAEPNRAFHLLDIVECSSRVHLLMGNRLLGLVQTNDPMLSLPKLGGCEASWNWDEFFTERRMRAAAAAPGEQGCPGKPA